MHRCPYMGTHAMVANSPFTEYMAAAVGIVLVLGILIAILIGGGLLILNLGMMSKREEDRAGGINPSDVGLLKSTLWPGERQERRVLPAMDLDEEEGELDEWAERDPSFGDRGSPDAGTEGVNPPGPRRNVA